MTRGLTFSEAFWDSDIAGTFGWETLCKRMKDGKKVCSDVAHYLKDRAKAEADYSKALQNLVKKADGKEETGILGDGWRALKAQTELIANAHEEAASSFSGLMDELNRFNEEQSKTKKQTEDNVKRYIQSKKNEYNKTMASKRTYEDKCKDFNNAEETMKTIRSSVTTKKSELDKADSKLHKAMESRDNADTTYRSNIESLENARKMWESEYTQGCNQLEELEVSRIDYLRDLLWKITNIDSIACVKHDDCSEIVRNVLEKCDVDADLQLFIESNKSGSKRPDPILYENYYNGKALPTTRPPAGLPLGIPPKQTATRPPIKPPSPTRPPPRNNVPEDDLYATVDSSASNTNSRKIYLKVVRDHLKTNSSSVSEISATEGDILEYLGDSNIPGFVKVKHHRNVGFIPRACVIEYNPDQVLVTI